MTPGGINKWNEILNHLLLRTIGAVADKLQIETYTVGGFVRDFFLNRTSKDIDIVCVGDGMMLAEAVAKHLDKNLSVTTFKNFGTAMLQWNGWIVEFVGARKESYQMTSRNPSVRVGTLEDDQLRRDFTINTLAICLNEKAYGLLLDPFNGHQDLQNGIIKTPCDPLQTFSDDPLRIIRAIRFASQLNFKIEQNTLVALTAVKERLKIVSQERITEELHKIIATSEPSYGFKILFETKTLELILPEMAHLAGKEQIGPHGHKDNFIHTLKVLDNVAAHSSKIWLRWSAIFHDIAKPLTKTFSPEHGFSFHGHEDLGAKMVPKIFRRMKFSMNKEVLGYVQKMVRLHLRPIALVENVTDSAIRRLLYEAGDDLEDLFLLCRADITSKNPAKVAQYLDDFDKVEAKILDVEARDKIKKFQPIITGEIIMKTFQLKPSPEVGFLKQAIKDAILDGKIKNEYKEAFNYLLTIGSHLLKR